MSIGVLFFNSCPTAVIWFVISIIIYAIYGKVLRWPFSHILKKILKTFKPPITNSYAPAPITFKSVIPRINTPIFYILPYFELRCFGSSMTIGQLSHDFSLFFKVFLAKATTASNGLSLKTISGYDLLFATHTFTKPSNITKFIFSYWSYRSQSIKNLVADIFIFHKEDIQYL